MIFEDYHDTHSVYGDHVERIKNDEKDLELEGRVEQVCRVSHVDIRAGFLGSMLFSSLESATKKPASRTFLHIQRCIMGYPT